MTRALSQALRGTQVGAVATGPRHSLAVAADGRVFGWGFGDDTLGLRAFHKTAPVYGACAVASSAAAAASAAVPPPLPPPLPPLLSLYPPSGYPTLPYSHPAVDPRQGQLGAGGGSGGGWRPPRPAPSVGSSFCLLTPTEYPRFIRLATE